MRKKARNTCQRAGDETVKPSHIGWLLDIPTRYIPADVLPMTGNQALAAEKNLPAWVAEGQEKHREYLAKRAEARSRPRPWKLDDLVAEYTLDGLKDGLPFAQAHRMAKKAAREARDTIGVQAAGELVHAGMLGRAGAIADRAQEQAGEQPQ
ncbi:hypothetical protein ACFV3R_25145 [Streptomyces sp. NPDC059740]|uniref:hypothetical protein n=1 Tax=Streptomyces sp. NPDC059740 TaxID=3346926 RepID=UPI00364FF03F